MEAESTLSVGGVGMTFRGCRDDDLPLIFRPFVATETNQDTGCYEVIHGRCCSTRLPVTASTDCWQLHEDGQTLCLEAGGMQDDHPLLSATLDQDWRRGRIQVDPAAPELTRKAPVTSHIGELILMARLSLTGGLLVHAATVSTDGGARLLLGRSGAGKSTLAGIAAGAGASVLSDDRTVLREEGGALCSFGTPFHGTLALASAQSLPVRSLYFLAHGAENIVRPLSAKTAARLLLSLSFFPVWSKAAAERAIESAVRLAGLAPAFQFTFAPTAAAASAILGNA